MQGVQTSQYHPFLHEIVEVEQTADPEEPITLIGTCWPGFMVGHLLFSRAGVKVRTGSKIITKEVAVHSTLYFTFVRSHRPTSDLSHGWGHNSQWSTLVRRDYEDEEAWYYNVDGAYDLTQESRMIEDDEREVTEGLTRAERIELLVNRCFIRTEKAHRQPWPFEDRYVEKKA
jgi:hypothetical protein